MPVLVEVLAEYEIPSDRPKYHNEKYSEAHREVDVCDDCVANWNKLVGLRKTPEAEVLHILANDIDKQEAGKLKPCEQASQNCLREYPSR